MAVRMVSPMLVEKNNGQQGLDTAWAEIKEGKTSRILKVYLHRMNTGIGWGCEVHHGVDSDGMFIGSYSFRVSKYKYLRGCPGKYLPVVKTLEKALRA